MRDRNRDPQIGGRGAQIHHRRRVSPRLVELRFSRAARGRRVLRRRAQDQIQRARPAAPLGAAARRRQGRRLRAAPDDRVFQVPQDADATNTEGDDPVAVRCISATAAMRCRNPSIRRWRISIATSAGPTPRRCGPSPMPAAAIFSSTRSTSPICAIRHCASTSSPAGKIRRRCRPSMPV